MKKYPFEHDGPVYLLEDDNCEIAYFARDGKKYQRLRFPLHARWEDSQEIEIDSTTFWMIVACIERSSRHA